SLRTVYNQFETSLYAVFCIKCKYLINNNLRNQDLLLDTQEVVGSSPIPPITTGSHLKNCLDGKKAICSPNAALR
ncbi:MAG: hypothetical protein KAS69_07345, partial [Planctomycetes bacterium]|nr:hypothetical protein [Planctomycetota bacterium]